MDSRRERVLAALLGGGGTAAGILLYQAAPDLLTAPSLKVRLPNAAFFLGAMFVVGALGGLAGHYLFLHVARGSIEGRAVVVGTGTGLAIALTGWWVTWLFRRTLFPLEPVAAMDPLMRVWLVNALLAGPIGGITAAMAVVRRLRRLTSKANLPVPRMVEMEERRTDSDIEIPRVARPQDLEGWDPGTQLGEPGEFPYTRGVHADMYRRRLWTMRQYSGFETAEATNQRFRFLLEKGQTGLSVAFDLPTQMGYDSDHPRADGEVGATGVAISSLVDMELLFDAIPLGEVSTSMTINSTAPILLLLYELAAERQGVEAGRISGTVQNDLLKEYAARGTYIYPPRASMRLVTDLFAYCRERVPRWNTISISGYHMREAGCTAVQEVGFTLANAIAYVEAALAAGLEIDEFAPRLSFFFACHMNFFEEVAKFRAARRIWARIVKERFGAEDQRSMLLRFHTQTGGATLTAQQPENNIVRTAYEALAAVLGGTQSLHTNSFDEALSLPTERAARIALRTQHVLAHETGVADAVDPIGGSYLVEHLTNEIERGAEALVARIDEMGGAVEAVESGWMKREIEESAYRLQRALEERERIVVGVNEYLEDQAPAEIHRPSPESASRQVERLRRVRAERDEGAVTTSLEGIRAAAKGTSNLLYPMREALSLHATLGEVSDVLREEFGTYEPAEAPV